MFIIMPADNSGCMARLRLGQISPYGETSYTQKTLYAIMDEDRLMAGKKKSISFQRKDALGT